MGVVINTSFFLNISQIFFAVLIVYNVVTSMSNKSMKKGVFCFSLDVELLWGKRDLDYENLIPSVKKEREIIGKLLELCKNYRISFTWAVVGKLFQNNANLLWSGVDIINNIKKTGLQEIASHSLSHSAFGDSSYTKEIAQREIKQCLELAKKMNIKLKSFVFPKNSIGHLDILKGNGFIAFRGKQSNILPEENPLHRTVKALDLFTPFSPPVFDQYMRDQGIVNIPASLHFLSNRGIRKFIPKGVRLEKAKKGIDKAIRERKIFHLWTHPLDIVDQNGELFDELKQIIEYVVEKRDRKLLNIKTMEGIAESCHE